MITSINETRINNLNQLSMLSEKKAEEKKEKVEEKKNEQSVNINVSHKKGIYTDEELQIAIENANAASSSIRSLVAADEMIKEANANILEHPAEATLAQANTTKEVTNELINQ